MNKIKSLWQSIRKSTAKIGEVMHEFKKRQTQNFIGEKVSDRDQAIAIGISEAEQEGYKVPKKPSKSKKTKDKKRNNLCRYTSNPSELGNDCNNYSLTKSLLLEKTGSHVTFTFSFRSPASSPGVGMCVECISQLCSSVSFARPFVPQDSKWH